MASISSIIGIGNVLPNFAKLANGDAGGAILDLAFKDSCLWMQNSTLLASWISFKIPLPVVGFQFQTPDDLELLKYTYVKYPALNKVAVANSFQKETTTITITGLRPITRYNPVGLNYVLNGMGMKNYIEKYADRGGTFALNTMWGLITDLVLTSVKGVKVDQSQIGGIGFEFSFEKLQFASLGTAENAAESIFSVLGAS